VVGHGDWWLGLLLLSYLLYIMHGFENLHLLEDWLFFGFLIFTRPAEAILLSERWLFAFRGRWKARDGLCCSGAFWWSQVFSRRLALVFGSFQRWLRLRACCCRVILRVKCS